MVQPLWSRSVEGERPGVLLGDDRVLLHYSASHDDENATQLLCFDFRGRELWSQSNWRGLLALPGNRFLVNTPLGAPQLINGSGQLLQRWFIGGIQRVVRHKEFLVLADARTVWATDLELNRLWWFPWPGASHPAIDCFQEGAFYWAEGHELKRCTQNGRSEVFCRLPDSLIIEAMDRYERQTGGSALLGWYITLREGSDFVPYRTGDRPTLYYWRISFDHYAKRFFLANATAPHLILSLDRFGQPLWCEYLSCGCCGGVPLALPNRQYVASSGCGGILTWFDVNGKLLYQSVPHKGTGLATAYASDVQILSNGRVLVDGGPGIVAYNSDGERLWIFARPYNQFHCNSEKGILVGSYWQNNAGKQPNKTFLEFAVGL